MTVASGGAAPGAEGRAAVGVCQPRPMPTCRRVVRIRVGLVVALFALAPLGACSTGTGGGRSPATQVPSGGPSTSTTLPTNDGTPTG